MTEELDDSQDKLVTALTILAAVMFVIYGSIIAGIVWIFIKIF